MRSALLLVGALLGMAASARAQNELPYSDAVATGKPHECSYAVPSFFGETQPFRAYVMGPDFHAVDSQRDGFSEEIDPRPLSQLSEPWRQHFVRLGGVGYTWPLNDGGARIDLGAIARAWGGTEADAPFAQPLLFFPPLPDARCRPTAAEEIALPDGIEFTDITEWVIAEMKKADEKEASEVAGLPFAVYLPAKLSERLPEITRAIVAEEQGIVEPQKKRAYFDYQRSNADEVVVFRIEESLPDSSRPLERCDLPVDSPLCQRLEEATAGHTVYRIAVPAGLSSRNAKAYRYHFDHGGTRFSLQTIHYRPPWQPYYDDPNGLGMSYRFQPGELADLLDSLEKTDTVTIQAIPRM